MKMTTSGGHSARDSFVFKSDARECFLSLKITGCVSGGTLNSAHILALQVFFSHNCCKVDQAASATRLLISRADAAERPQNKDLYDELHGYLRVTV